MDNLTLLVLASCHDTSARVLVSRWSNSGAKLLTCEDLSAIGWRQSQDPNRVSSVVAGRETLATNEISGVLVRLPFVMEQELVDIVPEDRSYVAAEMTSFLLYWLNTLKCPVVNKPTPACLCGPNWRLEQWINAASKAGLRVQPVNRHSSVSNILPGILDLNSYVKAIVVGKKCFGKVDNTLAEQATLLAKAAGVELLSVFFSGHDAGSFFVGADLMIENINDEVANAILQCLAQDGGSNYQK